MAGDLMITRGSAAGVEGTGPGPAADAELGDETASVSERGGPDVREIYRQVARARAAELRLREHIEANGFGGFWHPDRKSVV